MYVVLGGAGGIGRVTTEYLIRHYNAQVIWIGRSPFNDSIRASQAELAAIGKAPLYFQADANHLGDVAKVYAAIKEKNLSVNGIFHSALVLNDMLVENMDVANFNKAFQPKALASINLVEVFKDEPLDFICFYSSVQAIVNSAGQSNYAAGCAFKDTFAHLVKEKYGIAAYIINWGYWGDVGIVATDEYRKRMKRMGVGSISAEEGMAVLETALTSDIAQLIAIKTTGKEEIS